MIINRVYQYIKRKIQRKVEYEQYYKNSYNQIKYQIKEKQKICWFIGSAHYDNIGDQAISLYTTNFLEDLGFFVVDIRLCDYYKYLKALRKIVKKDDMIVLQGGGNMGYTYFDAEFNRREVIKSFPKNKIVIFPCTIDYGNSLREKKELERAKRICNRLCN